MSSLSRAELKKAKKASKQIDEQLKADTKAEELKGHKILLLGPGDSGKSTLLKQMKILHTEGFSKEESEDYKIKIHKNIATTAKNLILAIEQLKIQPASAANKGNMETIKAAVSNAIENDANMSNIDPLQVNCVNALKSLWNDENVNKEITNRSNELEHKFQDTAPYFIQELAKFFESGYTPSDDDILRLRWQTTAVTETQIAVKDNKYRIYDVGGQKSLRKYWLPYFDNTVKAIVFIASLASYDQFLDTEEDKVQTNKMQDAVQLFGDISNNSILANAAIILFLNKTDIFEEKLSRSSIKKYFPAYKDEDCNAKSARSFFKKLFLDQKKDPNRDTYTHYTNSTDTKLMKFMISAISEIIVKLNFKMCEIDPN